MSWIRLPLPQIFNVIHSQDSHALREKDKQDAPTQMTGMKEIAFQHSLNPSFPVLSRAELVVALHGLCGGPLSESWSE